jgi:hypothetical protein
MTAHLILLAGLLLGADTIEGGSFEARTLDGRAVAGQLARLDARQVVLRTDAGEQTLPLVSLAALVRQGARPAQPRVSNVLVALVDHGQLAGNDFTAGGSKAQLTISGGIKVEVPTRAIAWVRFGPPSGDDKLNKQWSDVVDTKADSDLLVMRKDGALDYLEGVQGDVDADSCKFEVDEEKMRFKRAKVEGIVYAHPRAKELPEPIGQLVTLDASRLALAEVALEGDALKIATTSGLRLALPLSEVAQFDFSSGKISYLSDLAAESANYVPFLSAKGAPASLADYYRFRRDSTFEQNPLRLDGKTYRKGLSLQSRTVLVYKLPGKFRSFKSTVGIDDTTREAGTVRVEIKGDGRELWQGEVRGTDPPKDLDLDVAGVKRLEITVDYGADGDVGDRLDLCEARVTK